MITSLHLISVTTVLVGSLASASSAGIIYPPITVLSGAQHSYAFVGMHGANDENDFFVWDASATGSPATGDTSYSNFNTYGTMIISSMTQVGISIFADVNAGATPELSFQQSFQCSTDFIINWTNTALPGGSSSLRIAKFSDATAVGGGIPIGVDIYYASNPGPLTLGATVGNEYYKVFYSNYGTAPVAAQTVMALTFDSVPAPGAVALISVAGLITNRRRRN